MIVFHRGTFAKVTRGRTRIWWLGLPRRHPALFTLAYLTIARRARRA
jgi:hypothetical protein